MAEVHQLAFEADLALARGKVAGDDLHQRRLPRPVVAHDADHFAGIDLEVYVVEGADGAKVLADALQLEQRFFSACCRLQPFRLPLEGRPSPIPPLPTKLSAPTAQTNVLTTPSKYSWRPDRG